MMAKRILRQGYYWSTMKSDCCQYVRRCHQYQIHGNIIHAPASELHNLTTPWPFGVWTPTAENGHESILVAIDDFTKWVEAANITANQVIRFLKRNIISRFGIPAEIITDNGSK